MSRENIVLATGNGEESKKIFGGEMSTKPEGLMNIPLDKYLDAKFAGLEGKLDAHLTGINQRFERVDRDVQEMRGEIRGQTKWIVGTGIALAGLFIAIVGYFTWTMQNQFNHHQSSIQAQMQSFSDYVKTVTQPLTPKPLPPSK